MPTLIVKRLSTLALGCREWPKPQKLIDTSSACPLIQQNSQLRQVIEAIEDSFRKGRELVVLKVSVERKHKRKIYPHREKKGGHTQHSGNTVVSPVKEWRVSEDCCSAQFESSLSIKISPMKDYASTTMERPGSREGLTQGRSGMFSMQS